MNNEAHVALCRERGETCVKRDDWLDGQLSRRREEM